MPPIVTLLTDFGTADGFVGAMKGLVLSRAPGTLLVDLTHDIPPQNVHAGAWALREAAATYPRGTVHVAVVDPGVGTERRPLLVSSGGQHFIGPDNGLLSLAVDDAAVARVLDRPKYFEPQVSRTFHGRDVFASVGGHLAAGKRPGQLGRVVERWQRLEEPQPQRRGEQLLGQVVHVDRFGNLVTNLHGQLLGDPGAWRVQLVERDLGPLRSTFGEVAPGRWLAYMGSGGRLEIAVRDGSAAERLGRRGRGTQVVLWPR